jgi:hypothetical protein
MLACFQKHMDKASISKTLIQTQNLTINHNFDAIVTTFKFATLFLM